MSKVFKAIFLQFSGIVGAGIFALPFIFYHTNFYFAVILLCLVAVIMFFLNSFYISIITKTKGDHQLSGYAQIYLGQKAKILSLLSLSFLCFGGILAYTKLASTFLVKAFPSLSLFGAALFFVSLIGFLHLSKINFSKSAIHFLPIISLIIVFILLISSFSFNHVNLNSNLPNFFCFGGIIFALSGFTIIPEIEEVLRSTKHKTILLRFSSLVGLIMAVVVYLIFSYSVIRISGQSLTSDSVVGVFNQHPIIGWILIFFGLTTVLKSSLNFMIVLKETFFQDFKLSLNTSYFLSVLVPFLSLFFINISFIKIISFIGTTSIFLSALIICLIRLKLSKSLFTKFFVVLILLTLFSGILLEYLF